VNGYADRDVAQTTWQSPPHPCAGKLEQIVSRFWLFFGRLHRESLTGWEPGLSTGFFAEFQQLTKDFGILWLPLRHFTVALMEQRQF
jgi:hypothetical protein